MIRRTYAPAQPTLTSGDDRPTAADIRAWARANGYEVASRGLPRAEVMGAYYAEQFASVPVVPEGRHRQTARRIARLSQQYGSEGVLDAIEDLMYDDLPMVVVELARMAREAL